VDVLTLETFSPLLNDRFVVATGATRLELQLVEATAQPYGRPGQRAPFTLLFHGPPSPILPQAIYSFEHPSLGRLEVFIVPIGPAPGTPAMRYEAVFN
jgi:hypothetical protein